MPTVTADGIYYVDLGPDPDFSLGTFQSVYPENCSFDHQVRGVGNCSFELSYSAKDQDGNPAVGPFSVSTGSWVGPYRDYFRLRYGDIAIMAGPLISVNAKARSDYMHLAGKTWEHFPELWQYPFDPRGNIGIPLDPVNSWRFPNAFQGDEAIGTGADTPTGLVYEASNRDLILIFSDIFSTTMNVGNRVIFDISELSGLSGIKTNYQFGLGDDTFMDAFITALSETGNGFDWWIGWDRVVHWGSPFRFGSPSAPFIFASVNDTWLDNGKILDTDFTNDGPNATHILGKGAGLASSTTLGRAYGYTPAQTIYSRFDRSYDFGDIRNAAQLVKRTQKQLSKDLQPKHTIPISFDPGQIANFWADFRVGRAIDLNIDYGFHEVDSYQQLISFQANLDPAGNAKVDWTIEQIYDLSINAGTPEA